MQESGLCEEWKVINQTQFQYMPLVEVRTRPAALRVVGVNDFCDRSVRPIVDRMPVGVRQASIQVAEIPADSHL